MQGCAGFQGFSNLSCKKKRKNIYIEKSFEKCPKLCIPCTVFWGVLRDGVQYQPQKRLLLYFYYRKYERRKSENVFTNRQVKAQWSNDSHPLCIDKSIVLDYNIAEAFLCPFWRGVSHFLIPVCKKPTQALHLREPLEYKEITTLYLTIQLRGGADYAAVFCS